MANAPQRPASNPQTPPSTSELAENTPDDRDVSPRAPGPDTSGKRIRAIPTHGGTTIEVSTSDFESIGVKNHQSVRWDFRKDNFTIAVGTGENEISEEAAKALTKHEPLRFEFLS